MMRYKILSLCLLLVSSQTWGCDYTAQLTMNDLEFYINTINCLESYYYCMTHIQPTNKNIDCLQNSQCQHFTALQALINLPYVQNKVLNLDQNNALNKLLITYGKNNLEQLVEEYPVATISNLINELTKTLNGPDLTMLTDANLKPIPPADFNG